MKFHGFSDVRGGKPAARGYLLFVSRPLPLPEHATTLVEMLPMSKTRLRSLVGLAALALCSGSALAAEAYTLTVNATTSAVTYTFSASAPFSGSLSGDPMPIQPPPPAAPLLATRLQQGTPNPFLCLFTSGCSSIALTTNQIIPISGTLAGTGGNTPSTPQRPTGSFTLSINPGAGTAEARNVSLNLVGVAPISTSANLNNFTYRAFCAAFAGSTTPTCTLFNCGPLSIPLGTVNVTAIGVTQSAASAGTLTPVVGDPASFDFSIPVSATVVTTSNFGGSAFPTDPQVVPVVLAGRITRTPQGGATATTNFSINNSPPTNTTPTPLDPLQVTFPADSPACAALPVLVTISLSSTTTSVQTTAAINAAGPRLRCACDADNDGARTVADIFAFLSTWFAAGPGSDFDNSGTRDVSDIFAFLSCWFAGQFPC